MNGRLERRYERLLRLYPKAYREQRGAEILATLKDAADDGRARPARREIAALILGAVRMRTGAAATTSPGQAWCSALRMAVLLLLAHATAQAAAHAGRVLFSELPAGRLDLVSDLGYLPEVAASALALVAIASARYALGAALAAVAFVSGQWALSWLPFQIGLVYGEFWQLPLAVLLALSLLALSLLAPRPAGSRHPVAWLLAVPFALFLLPTQFDAALGWQPWALLAVDAAFLAWSLVDARAAIAGAALLLSPSLSLLGFELPGWVQGLTGAYRVLLPVYLVLAVVMVGIGGVLVRRRARA